MTIKEVGSEELKKRADLEAIKRFDGLKKDMRFNPKELVKTSNNSSIIKSVLLTAYLAFLFHDDESLVSYFQFSL